MKRPRLRPGGAGGAQCPSCAVDGCKADLSKCRDYHRRHKVCETHSKTPIVVVTGREMRFCQQCSRGTIPALNCENADSEPFATMWKITCAITFRGLLQSSYIRGESRFFDHGPVYNLFMAKVGSVHHRRSNLTLIMISSAEGTVID
ncbi:Squamosa promoter-binding-like protein 18 [Zea mays]|uniref:Squamosa promoter-binding-like protein 18 n=1 Tax=Zea mays TaxID=4577 RepID=A0A1D6LWA5_MAIZE|nr:Squamosa promoter-binding-like protein 18 [Zea mays]